MREVADVVGDKVVEICLAEHYFWFLLFLPLVFCPYFLRFFFTWRLLAMLDSLLGGGTAPSRTEDTLGFNQLLYQLSYGA